MGPYPHFPSQETEAYEASTAEPCSLRSTCYPATWIASDEARLELGLRTQESLLWSRVSPTRPCYKSTPELSWPILKGCLLFYNFPCDWLFPVFVLWHLLGIVNPLKTGTGDFLWSPKDLTDRSLCSKTSLRQKEEAAQGSIKALTDTQSVVSTCKGKRPMNIKEERNSDTCHDRDETR